MSENYKPGDIAIITDRAGAEEIGICTVGGRVTGRADAARWRVLSGGEVWSSVTAARPLVVIDPEDCEQVKALYDAYYAVSGAREFGGMADALRSLIDSKPAEPTGWLSIVQDRGGELWVRDGVSPDLVNPWRRLRMTSGTQHLVGYHRIDAAKVLSEGVDR